MTVTDPGWVLPRYGAASLPDVLPSAVTTLVGDRAAALGFVDHIGLAARLDGVRRIGVVLVDGLGYHQLEAAAAASTAASAVAAAVADRGSAGYGAIADILAGRLGALLPLTAGFPSTTPVSVVGLGTGTAPGAHGVIGFSVRVPGTDRVLNHIKWWDDPDPSTWQPVPTVFERAVAAGLAATVVTRPAFAGSGLTVAAYRGAAYRPAGTIDEVVTEVRDALAYGDGPTLVYGYHPDLDRAGHASGVASAEWRDAAADADILIGRLADDLPSDTAILVTADHGQLDVPEDRRFDLDTDRALRSGVDVVAGEPRVRYLHTAPGAAPDVIDTWRAILGDNAWIGSRDEVVDAGLYGDVTAAHLERIGDVVVICRDDYVVVQSVVAPSEASLVAYHGALSATEMMIPLIVVRG
ncbi:MAG TPA: alkaline phosphatase family protein [Micromonosporaceae bacterium]|nr:alkaline phosphatase family protein [Micromonosporaceae bacterium]